MPPELASCLSFALKIIFIIRTVYGPISATQLCYLQLCYLQFLATKNVFAFVGACNQRSRRLPENFAQQIKRAACRLTAAQPLANALRHSRT